MIPLYVSWSKVVVKISRVILEAASMPAHSGDAITGTYHIVGHRTSLRQGRGACLFAMGFCPQCIKSSTVNIAKQLAPSFVTRANYMKEVIAISRAKLGAM